MRLFSTSLLLVTNRFPYLNCVTGTTWFINGLNI
jgi:hypothetical protein